MIDIIIVVAVLLIIGSIIAVNVKRMKKAKKNGTCVSCSNCPYSKNCCENKKD